MGTFALFTAAGVALLGASLATESPARDMLINAGTGLALFAGLEVVKSSLVRGIDAALMRPKDLVTAQARVARGLRGSDLSRTPVESQVKHAVLAAVVGAGFAQDSPLPGGVRLRGGHIDWWVQWELEGVAHHVTLHTPRDGCRQLGRRHATPTGWKAPISEHEKVVLEILIELLQLSESSAPCTAPGPAETHPRAEAASSAPPGATRARAR